jgi:hypothetical protein
LLDPNPIGEDAEQQASAEAGQAFQAVDADRRHRRNAAADGVAHHVEDRSGMRRAAQEERQREDDELRRAQRLRGGQAEPVGRDLRAGADTCRPGRLRRLPHQKGGGDQQKPGEARASDRRM